MVAQRIGVETRTGIRSGPTNPGSPSGVLHLVGLTATGPVDQAVTIRSLAEYTTTFGDRTSYANSMFDSTRVFFEEGGAELLISRVVGPDASVAGVDLTTEGGEESPGVSLARIEARDPGSFANEWTVRVGDTNSDGMVTIEVLDAEDEPIATWRNIGSPADLVHAARSARRVNVLDLGADDAGSFVPGEYALSDGTDDRESVTSEHVIEALDRAAAQGRGGSVAAPGHSAENIGQDLIDYATRSEKIALLAAHEDANLAEVEAIGDNLAQPGGDYAGLFYPWLTVPDGNATRTVSPEAYIGAVRARAFTEVGYWQVPAGDRSRTRWVAGTVTDVSQGQNNELSGHLVNGIVTTNGRTRLYNWRSLSTNEDMVKLSSRDVLNNLSVQIERVLEPHVFSTIDARGQLFSRVKNSVISVLEPVARQDGFFARIDEDGDEIDPGYSVQVDVENNPTDVSEDNRVVVDVGVRLSPTAALIQVEIVKVALTGTL